MNNIDNLINDFKNKEGKVIGKSKWIKIDQKIISDFAIVTMDNQFIHLDHKRAIEETPFGSTIAHGFLILSLCTKFFVDVVGQMENEKMGINYGFNKVRFVNPVKCNDKIRGVFTLQEVSKRSQNEILFNHHLNVEIEGIEKPAVVCEWLNLSVINN